MRRTLASVGSLLTRRTRTVGARPPRRELRYGEGVEAARCRAYAGTFACGPRTSEGWCQQQAGGCGYFFGTGRSSFLKHPGAATRWREEFRYVSVRLM